MPEKQWVFPFRGGFVGRRSGGLDGCGLRGLVIEYHSPCWMLRSREIHPNIVVNIGKDEELRSLA